MMVNLADVHLLAVLKSDGARQSLQDACSEMNGTAVNVSLAGLDDLEVGSGKFDRCDALLVEVDPRDAEEFGALQEVVRALIERKPIIATAASATLQDIRALMRVGVVDFIPQPITQHDLVSAVQVAVQKEKRGDGPSRPQVITFIKGGGGVGATTLAVQSGCALRDQIRKEEDSDVCLIDFDVQFGNAALYLDLNPKSGLVDLVDSADRMDATLLRSVMTSHESGLDVLAAPPRIMPLDIITPNFATHCLKLARSEYRHVIVELPHAWTPWTGSVLDKSDRIILVTQLTVPCIQQARRQIDTLEGEGLVDDRLRIVLNRFDKTWSARRRLKEAQRGLRREISYHVSNDFKTVSEAANEGVALHEVGARTKVQKDIASMIAAIASETDRPAVAVKAN